MSRFFVLNDSIKEDKIIITGDDVLHIQKVLRMKEGDSITLCNGEGTDFLCEIEEVSKKGVLCRIKNSFPNENEPICSVTLFQAVPQRS